MTLSPRIQKRIELNSVIGAAITRWSDLEELLFQLTAFALNISPYAAFLVITTHRSFSGQLDVVNVAMKLSLANSIYLSHWNSLVEYTQELSGDRNRLAHCHVVGTSPKGGFGSAEEFVNASDVDWVLAEPAKPFTATSAANALTVQDILEIKLDFDHLIESLNAFHLLLTGQSPYDEKFARKVVRRRPPRKERQAAKPPTRKSRPKPSRA